MDKIKRWRQINIADIFTGFAVIYLVYSFASILFEISLYRASFPHVRWFSFFNLIANTGFKVLVLFGISAVLRRLIKN
ncbi:hypothetical protein D7V87_02350 [Clostridium sp. 1xD42-85]|nr:hypothetical protein D7V87_02350 [Clostridium sp. 1xD42-85]